MNSFVSYSLPPRREAYLAFTQAVLLKVIAGLLPRTVKDRKCQSLNEYFCSLFAGFDVAKTGDARIGFVGFPSVGKSTLLSNLAGVYSEVAAYEFTTLTTVPGVIRYKGAKIQVRTFCVCEDIDAVLMAEWSSLTLAG